MSDLTQLKGYTKWYDDSNGAHYYAHAIAGSATTYSEAFANIVLPTSLNRIPSGVSTEYSERNAYISLGIHDGVYGCDMGIGNRGNGWEPVYYDVKSGTNTWFPTYKAKSSATNAIIVAKPVSSTKVGLYVRFTDANGNTVGTPFDDQTLPVATRTTWTHYYRFASLVHGSDLTDVRTDSTYMTGGKFTNLGLYNKNTSSYEKWGISTDLIERAYIVYYPKCQVTYTNNSDTFRIDHWA